MTDRLNQLLEMLKEMPGDPFLKYGVALEYVSRNNDMVALNYFSELHKMQPDYLALYYQLGKLLERLQKNEEATAIYEEGITIARRQKDMHTLSELQNALDEME